MSIQPAKMPRNRRSNAQVIIDWFEGRIGDHELTDPQKEYFERVKAAYKSQLAFHSKHRTIKALAKTYEVSEATAQRIYTDSEKIFGSQRKFNKEFARHKAEEMALSTFRKARQAGALKTMAQAVNAYIRASGIEMEDADIPDFATLEPGDVVTMLPQAIQDAILTQLQGGSVDLNQAPYDAEAIVIDITPEEDDATG